MDDFEQLIVDCFNATTSKKAKTAEEVLNLLDDAFKAGDRDHPLRFK